MTTNSEYKIKLNDTVMLKTGTGTGKVKKVDELIHVKWNMTKSTTTHKLKELIKL